MASLEITRLTGFGRGKKQSFAGGDVTLGTDAASLLRFDPTWDKTVAPRHAVLRWQGVELWLEDLGSRDGTWLSGRRVQKEKLVPGSVLELGKGGPTVKLDWVPEVAPADAITTTVTRATPFASPAAQPQPVTRGVTSSTAAHRSRGVPSWVYVTAVVLVLALLGGAAFWKTISASASSTSQRAPRANAVEWQPYVAMGGQLFPSYLIATATISPSLLPAFKGEYRLGDPAGVIGVRITAPADQTEVDVGVEANDIMKASSTKVTLPKQGGTYVVYPKITYDYQALLRVKQAIPITLVLALSINETRQETRSFTVRLNSINDCPFTVLSPDKKESQSIEWMFAAYVNENHPWSEQIRKDALKSGVVGSFLGYQRGPDEVLNQVFAIWHEFQKRGFRYSSITTTSATRDRVAVQQVRFIDQSIDGAQANCADGSVLFASVLRQIGIEPVLICTSDHMFVGFYTVAGDEKSICYIETTMMGDTDLSKFSATPDESSVFAVKMQVITAASPHDPKVKASAQAFDKALVRGKQEAKEYQDKGDFLSIRIDMARRAGITPIAYQP